MPPRVPCVPCVPCVPWRACGAHLCVNWCPHLMPRGINCATFALFRIKWGTNSRKSDFLGVGKKVWPLSGSNPRPARKCQKCAREMSETKIRPGNEPSVEGSRVSDARTPGQTTSGTKKSIFEARVPHDKPRVVPHPGAQGQSKYANRLS